LSIDQRPTLRKLLTHSNKTMPFVLAIVFGFYSILLRRKTNQGKYIMNGRWSKVLWDG